MAVYQFSALSDGQAISFDPNADVLNFDQTAIAAADIRVHAEGSNLRLVYAESGKDVVLLGTASPQLTTGNITFADGSRLIFGDNTTGQSADNSANSLLGSTGADHLWGLGGNDTLSGGAGDDWLAGGTGQDNMTGGTGADRYVFVDTPFNSNYDRLHGFVSGTDEIWLRDEAFSNIGASGNFSATDGRFYAAAGASGGHDADDRIIYNTSNGNLYYDADGSGAERAMFMGVLHGAPTLAAADIVVFGDDTASPPSNTPTNGNDMLVGTAGNDSIDGLGGDDSISGLGGIDSLVGGAGNDTLNGGADVDYFFFAGEYGADAVDGGAGSDWLNFQGVERALTIDFRDGTATASGGGGSGSVAFVNVEVAIATRFGDRLVADDAGRALLGYDGMDTLIGGAGNDLLNGDGVFRDPVGSEFGQADEIFGGGGRDELLGFGGGDTLNGGADEDVLEGGVGADVFVLDQPAGALHADAVRDFSSEDDLWLHNAAMPGLGATGRFAPADARFFAGADANSGHDASDRVVYNTSTGQLWYDADGSGGTIAALIATLEGAPSLSATDIVVIGQAGATITGTTGNDTLVGTAGNDTIDGLAGNDSISGLAGDDSLIGSAGADTLDGGMGNDTFVADEADVLLDASGIDTVVATNGEWWLAPGFENLIVTGTPVGFDIAVGHGNGLDNVITIGDIGVSRAWIIGDGGNDTLIGNDENSDDFIFEGDYGNDTVDGGIGAFDVLDFQTAGSPIVIDFRSGTAVGGGTAGAGSVAFTNIEFAVGGDAGDRLIADDSGVELMGHLGADTLIGGEGDDVLQGDSEWSDHLPTVQGGNDQLFGHGGNDAIIGGAELDTLSGGAGNDTLFGDTENAFADAFVFDQPAGAANADVIEDFEWLGVADELHLDNRAMPNLGSAGRFAPGDARFFAGDGANAGQDASNRVIYNTSTGQLWYDADGAGSIGSQLIATLQGIPSLAATDIVVVGDSVPAPIVGTQGNDTLVGTNGNDTIDGLGGDDDIDGAGGSDLLIGGEGNDSIDGGMDNGEPWLFAGSDTLVGGNGNDTLDGAFNIVLQPVDRDSLDGGMGDDVFLIDDPDEALVDSGGVDLVVAFDVDWTLGAGFENFRSNSDQSEGAYTGIGNELDNVMSLGWGGGRLEGRGGDDTLAGSFRAESVLLGGEGNDSLEGGPFGTVDGGAGDDTLSGFSATGGLGADRFLVGEASGITDFTSGEDKLRLNGELQDNVGPSGNFAAGDERFHAAPGATGAHDATDRLIYNTTTGELHYDPDGTGSATAVHIGTLDGSAALVATDIEVVNGAASGSVINGTSGNDSLAGTAVNDTIVGFGGADTLNGGAGDDWLEGGTGQDAVTGGAGADSFVFRDTPFNTNYDRVFGFASGTDELVFDRDAYTAIGAAGDFAAGDGRFFAAAGASAGHDADDRLIYNTTNGNLYYDADGSGGGRAMFVGVLHGGPDLDAGDITVI